MRLLVIVSFILAALALYLGFIVFIGKFLAFGGRNDATWLRSHEGLAKKAQNDKDGPATSR
jgi:hypothetical protein